MLNNLLRQPSRGAHYALLYITIGTLVVIWTAIWLYAMNNSNVPAGDWKYYVCVGFMLSGVAVIIIGILVGRIGREAQNADVPVGQVTAAAVAPVADPVPAAPAATVVPAAPAAAPQAAPQAVTANGQPAVPVQPPVQQPVSPPVQNPVPAARR